MNPQDAGGNRSVGIGGVRPVSDTTRFPLCNATNIRRIPNTGKEIHVKTYEQNVRSKHGRAARRVRKIADSRRRYATRSTTTPRRGRS